MEKSTPCPELSLKITPFPRKFRLKWEKVQGLYQGIFRRARKNRWLIKIKNSRHRVLVSTESRTCFEIACWSFVHSFCNYIAKFILLSCNSFEMLIFLKEIVIKLFFYVKLQVLTSAIWPGLSPSCSCDLSERIIARRKSSSQLGLTVQWGTHETWLILKLLEKKKRCKDASGCSNICSGINYGLVAKC